MTIRRSCLNFRIRLRKPYKTIYLENNENNNSRKPGELILKSHLTEAFFRKGLFTFKNFSKKKSCRYSVNLINSTFICI